MKKNKIRCWTIHTVISDHRNYVEKLIKNFYPAYYLFFQLDGIHIGTNVDSIMYIIFDSLYLLLNMNKNILLSSSIFFPSDHLK